MRKNMNYLAVMAAAALLGLTACNEEAALTQPAEPQNPPVADNSGNVYITGDDFTWELGGGDDGGDASSVGAVTRSQLIVDGNTAKFTWTPGDRVGILPDQGAQVWFEIPTPAEGEDPTNVATFDGGAWALKPTSDYAAYYPFVKDFDLDRTKVPVSYTGQAQTGNGSTAHLGAFDYQGARPSTTNGAGGVSFDFDHVGALVLLQFTVPTSGTRLTGVTLSADGAEFTTKGTYDLTSTEGFPITSTKTAESMTIGLDHTTTADGETVTLYFMCAPIDLSGKTVSVSVACGGTEGETIEFEADGKNLVAAGGYLLKKKEPPYLTFSADAKQTLKLTKKNNPAAVDFQYSVNGSEWGSATVGEAIAFGGEAGNLRLRAKSPIGTVSDNNDFYQISFGNATPVECTGDIRTLVDWENYATASTAEARFCRLFEYCTSLTTAPELPATTLADDCYSYMFYGCTSLTIAPELPATTLADHCYDGMFYNCTSLTTAPELPATTLAESCYYGMFSNCSSLTTAPKLPATTLADYCYSNMFDGCSSLTTAPELPATTLAKYCYYGMFNSCTSLTTAPELPATTLAEYCYHSLFAGCTSLTTAPELPATTLARYCYQYMFNGCTSLTTAPELPATTLVADCYLNMFRNCSKLSSITMLATDISATRCLYQWVNGVASSGTFYKNSEATWTTTGTSGIPEGWTVEVKKEPPYLTFAALDGQTLTLTKNNNPAAVDFQYSVNGSEWGSVTVGEAIAFGGEAGNLRLRAKSPTGTASDYDNHYQISFGKATPVECTGDIRTLVDWENYATASTATARFCSLFAECASLTTAPELPATTLANRCYQDMFYECTSLTTAPELPATTLAEYCYNFMFYNCISLTTAPELPATTLADYCYIGMFYNCISLTTAPELPATTLAEGCYNGMFGSCYALTTAPELPATTLADYCYCNMFYNCISLTTAPELPATTLAGHCYYYMFEGCTSLTTAPELPATTLAKGCYRDMFGGCTNLSSITMLATDISATNCLTAWVEGVASSGTFYKNSAATWTTTGTSGIPEGWKVQDYTPAGE